MKSPSFLSLVAADLRRRFGTDMSRVAVVFPGKRAALFFGEHLLPQNDASPAEAAVRAPRYFSIDDLYHTLTPLTEADPIEVICRMHRLYTELTGSTETLDAFYGWGERLLSDFNETDRAMAPVERLFRNLADIKQLDTLDHIDEERERVLQSFFHDFSLERNNEIRQRFLELWNALFPLYTRLAATLAENHLAWNGHLKRDAVQRLNSGQVSLPQGIDHYAIVGFNALDATDRAIFDHIDRSGQAIFYWDYDQWYAGPKTTGEAGLFIRQNLQRYPNALPPDVFRNFNVKKEVEIVAAAGNGLGTRSAAQWLRQQLTPDARQTAVVLCDERMLLPLLHVLPSEVNQANITTNITRGYPLLHTRTYARLMRQLDSEERTTDIIAALDHLTEYISSDAREQSAPLVGSDEPVATDDILESEARFVAFTTLNRFSRLVRSGLLNVDFATLRRLLLQVVRQASVPFHGEPATGLQIMGMLETRCLDFDHILILSADEGTLPPSSSTASFIPLLLRRAYGLPTPAYQGAVSAYNFYRLIQRAGHVRIVYNASTGGHGRGEMSRFLQQLMVESTLPIRHLTLTAEAGLNPWQPQSVAKPADLRQRLTRLSPSAINTYLRCPISFYLKYVLKVKEVVKTEGIVSPNIFGNVFHASAEGLYRHLADRRDGWIMPDALRTIRTDDLLPFVERAMADEGLPPTPLVRSTVARYLQSLTRYESRGDAFRLWGTETEVEHEFTLPLSGHKVTLHGFIDRLDRLSPLPGMTGNGVNARILDYKTGGKPERVKTLDQLFTPAASHPHYALQTFIYALLIARLHPECEAIRPELFFVVHATADDYTSQIYYDEHPLLNFIPLADAFEFRLLNLLEEIFDPDIPFSPTPISSHCRSCPFQYLCAPARKPEG